MPGEKQASIKQTGDKRAGYKDIKATILTRLRDKTWPPGSFLPNEVDLAAEFGCARTTINRALRELAEEGILDRKRKAGTRVNALPIRQARFAIPAISAEVAKTGATYRYARVGREIMDAPEWLAAQLDLTPGADVLHLRCMHYADGQPFQFEDRWIVLDTVPSARDVAFVALGPNEWLIAEVPFTNAQLSFSARVAGRDLATFLNAAEGDALYTVERTTWLDNRPVTFARMSYRPGYVMTTAF